MTLINQIELEAEQFRKRSKLDNSIDSLLAIDKYFEEHLSKFVPSTKKDLIEENIQLELFSIAAYLGETLKENMLGATWQPDESDPENLFKVALKLPDESIIWPFERVFKRFYNGSEDSIYAYGYILTETYYEKKSKE